MQGSQDWTPETLASARARRSTSQKHYAAQVDCSKKGLGSSSAWSTDYQAPTPETAPLDDWNPEEVPLDVTDEELVPV